MKNLSYWAKAHPQKARWIIVAIHSLLFTLAVGLGFFFWMEDLVFDEWLKYALTGVTLAGVAFYPVKRSARLWLKHSYLRQKSFDAIIIFSGFLALSVCVPSQLSGAFRNALPTGHISTAAAALPAKSEGETVRKKIGTWQFMKQAWKLKKEWKAFKKAAKNGDKDAFRILGTLLVIVLVILLGYLLAVLACTYACSGQEAAASILLTGGWLLLLALLVVSIVLIWRKDRKNPASDSGS